MRFLKQSTARNLMVFLVDSTDHVTGKTGLTLTITASKDGGAFASITPTVTERGTGWYNLALTAAHTDTLGDLALHITGTAADPLDVALQVVAFDPGSGTSLGLSNLDAAVSSRSTFAGGGVASVTADVGITQAAADKVWGTTARTLTSFGTLVADIWAYATRTLSAFSTSLAVSVWDVLESAIATASSIGLKLKTNLDAAVSSRSTYAGGAVASVTADVGITQAAADKVWSTATRTLTSFGTLIADIWASATRTLSSFGTLVADVWASATRALTDKAGFSLAAGQLAVKKNAALANFEFLMVDSADHITPKTGLTVTAERSIDGAAFAACANAATEVASGIYKITLAAADLNGNVITLKFTAAGADARFVTMVTQA